MKTLKTKLKWTATFTWKSKHECEMLDANFDFNNIILKIENIAPGK